MMNLKYPGNAAFIASQLISILNADILDPTIICNIVSLDFKVDEKLMEHIEGDPGLKKLDILNQVKDMDFETFNPITNVGGLFIVVLLLFVEFILAATLKCVVTWLKKVRKR